MSEWLITSLIRADFDAPIEVTFRCPNGHDGLVVYQHDGEVLVNEGFSCSCGERLEAGDVRPTLRAIADAGLLGPLREGHVSHG